ncbi:MAG: hypothetical protein KDN20_26845 [Verrucomicrobiae bacterium]|nr:hypothetical protein [Verrucomicrobiae bacterium]
MNTSTPPPQDDFEKELSTFQRAPLPDGWRDDLLAKALPSGDPSPAIARRLRFSRSDRIMAGAIAMIWIAILCLRITQPEQAPIYSFAPSKTVGAPPSISLFAHPTSESLPPMLAWRSEINPNLAPFLNP